MMFSVSDFLPGPIYITNTVNKTKVYENKWLNSQKTLDKKKKREVYFRSAENMSCKTYPNVQLRPMVEFPFKNFWSSIRRAAAPCVQWTSRCVVVTKTKVCQKKPQLATIS